MLKRRLALAAFILIACLGSTGGQVMAAPLPQEAQALIVSPAAGSVVNGTVDIVGTAAHPNVTAYEVFYATGSEASGSSQWVSIVRVEGVQVQNDVLGAWDTTAIPDGSYTLAISVWWEGGGQAVRFTNNVSVKNEGITPTPTEIPLPTAVPGTATPVPVEMPPTFTPRPSPTPLPGETPVGPAIEGEGEGGELAVNLGGLRGAFFNGVKVAVLLFGVWGLYVFGKAAVRYYLRTGGSGLPPWKRR